MPSLNDPLLPIDVVHNTDDFRGVVYDNKFYGNILEIPFDIMLRGKERSVEGCVSMPKVSTDSAGAYSFLLDTQFINEKDCYVDAFGRWNSKTIRTKLKRFYVDEDGKAVGKRNHNYVVSKKYGRHPDTNPPFSLRKCLWIIHDSLNMPVNGFALLSYRVDCTCTVIMNPHGNAKQDTSKPYLRTLPSALERMANELTFMKPSCVKEKLAIERGLLAGDSEQALVRNLNQLYCLGRRKSKIQSMDDVFNIIRSKSDFVRYAEFDGNNERFFCANKSMLESFRLSCVCSEQKIRERLDMSTAPSDLSDEGRQQFFTDPQLIASSLSHYSPAFITTTHRVADLYATIIAFRHRFITPKTFESPHGAVCVAAIAFTRCRNVDDFMYIGICLSRLLHIKENERVRCLVTDVDDATKGLRVATIFRRPTSHLLCELHLRRNTETLLNGLTPHQKMTILETIYGSEGLVDCVSEEHFMRGIRSHQEQWDEVAPQFTNNFLATQGKQILQSYLLPQRFQAGIGYGRVTSNTVENFNSWLLDFLASNSRRGLNEMFSELEIICEQRYAELARCCLGGTYGEFQLKDEFKEKWISADHWAALTNPEKVQQLKSIGIHVPLDAVNVSPEVDNGPAGSRYHFPTNLSALYTNAERIRIVDNAELITRQGCLKQISDRVFVIDKGSRSRCIRVERQNNGKVICSCAEKRPVCAHNLALAYIFKETGRLLQIMEDGLTSKSNSPKKRSSAASIKKYDSDQSYDGSTGALGQNEPTLTSVLYENNADYHITTNLVHSTAGTLSNHQHFTDPMSISLQQPFSHDAVGR
ncbi:unnamed protein product [Anisakis simplex]|uniref:SWIM-type domain-containing protein n=1 Tax=Anisakis simplex TaxID=6269 RepID=A0A0M3JYR4_ANISI|nr:unnamed protein product [Anisakis simplex]